MSYIDNVEKIRQLMKSSYTKRMWESGDFDIIFLVRDATDPFFLVYNELGKILDCCFNILTGKIDTNEFVREVRDSLEEENKPEGGKVAEALLNTVVNPIKKELGSKFPLEMKEETRDENVLHRENILKEIENPGRINPKPSSPFANTKVVSSPSETHIIISGKPSEISHNPITLSQPTSPKPVGSIIEQKMNSVTSLPKKEVTITPQPRPPQKTYEKDPYREPIK